MEKEKRGMEEEIWAFNLILKINLGNALHVLQSNTCKASTCIISKRRKESLSKENNNYVASILIIWLV